MLPPRPAGKKILVVEDDFMLGETISLLLGAEGYRVAVAANGREAMRLLRGPERPHLILLDLMMPVMDGQQFRDELRQDPELAAIPTVVFSAAADARQRAEALGAAAFLQKPVDTVALLEAVKCHCRQSNTSRSAEGAGEFI
jgi:CheY-like chemotaxis protein